MHKKIFRITAILLLFLLRTALPVTQAATLPGGLPIPSVEDERNTYTSWGWTFTAGQVPNLAADPSFSVTDPGSHNDTEGDDLWTSLMMYRRGGGQGYLDRAKAWVTYYKTRYLQCLPADGETFCFDRDNFLMDHVYGWGLVAWYEYTCANSTCDTAALTVAEDIAAQVEDFWAHRANGRTTYPTPGQWTMAYYDLRGPGRHLLLITRVAEATGKQRWITLRDRLIELFMQSPDWDATRGMYFVSKEATDSALGAGTYDSGVRVNSAFQIGILAEAFEQVYRVTGRQDVKDRLIAMANYVNQYGLDPTYQYTGSRFGHKNGAIWHNYSRNGSTNFWDSVYTTSLVNTLVFGYKYTGNRALYDRAKYFLNRGTKGIYGDPSTRTAGDTQVHHFIDSTFDNGSGNFYFRYNKGELQYTYLLFLNGGLPPDLTPPSAPKSLKVN